VTEVSGEKARNTGLCARIQRILAHLLRSHCDSRASAAKQYRLETLILPLIDNSIYSAMAQVMGGKPVALDALRPAGAKSVGCGPTSTRNSCWISLVRSDCEEETPAREGVKPVRTTTNDLKQFAIGMHAYHDTNGYFPPAASQSKDGKPLLSWRVAILPISSNRRCMSSSNRMSPG